ncbi:MAG: hypothetical protein OEZ43_12455 [Gammaproteobacteria bacterium]|nr:hypothetical protein [Gammaproteobacteria bacterium]
MSRKETVSDEKLNALLDNELDNDDRAHVLSIMQQDQEVASRYCALRRTKDSIALAYSNPPLPSQLAHSRVKTTERLPFRNFAASFALIICGAIAGWIGGQFNTQVADPGFLSIDQIQNHNLQSNRVLIHISDMNPRQILSALDTAKGMLASQDKSSNLQLEIVANSDGIDFMREGSPFAQEIRQMTSDFSNVTFRACSSARSNAELREGRRIAMLPDVHMVPMAFDFILTRLSEGWTYVRG